MIKVNRQAKLSIEYIVQDKTPIIIIDNYIENLDELVNKIVENSQFKPDAVSYYPGERVAIAKPFVVKYLKPLMDVFYRVYKVPNNLQLAPKDNYFSWAVTAFNLSEYGY
ncbi:DUF6445 family protein [Colwellia sp. UCD-KL20]|uniref:DUF6445 family protein n=1 Tax=Colwellia sp. UCD-KL20 TaxID=1917165 RepID=UPI0009714A00|nr:DUF6445 family protein [Colwellia sp. UCD-KL20]